MLHGDVLVAHPLCLVLRIVQSLVQVLTDVGLAAGDLYPPVQRVLDLVPEHFLLDAHLFNELQDQAVLLVQKYIQQVLLLDLLIAEIVSGLLQLLDRIDRFLCKFRNVHTGTSFHVCCQ